ncbi:MAG: hypothetical protein FWB86_00125 [Treponema sp.]|nr:hypothetical protein [Treponema sp.]MCL2251542.1 hypothetical protein [Treponema sp.]
MGQKENLELLLQLHNIITGTSKTVEEIVSQRSIDPDISLIHNSELVGKVFFGRKIPVSKYYSLGDHLENTAGTSGKA